MTSDESAQKRVAPSIFPVFLVDDGFQKAVGLFERMGAWNGSGGRRTTPGIDALFFCIVFTQSDAGQRRVDEDGIGERCAVFLNAVMVAEQVVPDDAIVVQRNVRELRAALDITDSPDVRVGRFQVRIDDDGTTGIGFEPGCAEVSAQPFRDVGRLPAGRHRPRFRSCNRLQCRGRTV